MSKQKSKKHPKKRQTKSTTRPAPAFHRWLPWIPVLLAVLLYSSTLGHEYALDDASVITENFVTKKGVDGWGEVFTKHYRYGYWSGKGSLYRPLSLAMFALEWDLAPNKPWLYHLINVLLYALTAWLLYKVVARLFPKYNPVLPFFSSILFVVHPIHVEVIANIKSRDEILALLFGLATIYALLRYWKSRLSDQAQPIWLAYAVGAYTLALFSKETAITFLAVFPLVGYFRSRKVNLVDSATPTAIFLLPAVIYLLCRRAILGSALAGSSDISLLDNFIVSAPDLGSKLASAILIGGKYLKTLALPHPLASEFGYNQIPVTGLGDWRVWLSLLAFAGLGYLVIRTFKQRSPVAFGILFFLITFSIFSNIIITIGTSYGDRLMYTPSVGLVIALAFGLIQFFKPAEHKTLKSFAELRQVYLMPLAITGVIALLYGGKTLQRNPAWKDSFTLYEKDIKTVPNSAKLNYHYGLELNKKGLAATDPAERKRWWDLTLQHFQRAIEIYDQYGDAYGQLGLINYRQKNYPEALRNYDLAVKYKPGNANAYSNMGIIYFEQGNLAKAKEVYELAVKYNPRFVDARRNLGAVYAKTGQPDLAIQHFSEGLKYADAEDQPVLYLYLGYAYRDKGDNVRSQQNLERAYQLNPSLRPAGQPQQ